MFHHVFLRGLSCVRPARANRFGTTLRLLPHRAVMLVREAIPLALPLALPNAISQADALEKPKPDSRILREHRGGAEGSGKGARRA